MASFSPRTAAELATLLPRAASDLSRESPSHFRERFEAQALSAKHAALLIAGLHLVSRLFGLFALFWSTAVLLGAFAPFLCTLDFLLVSALLLLEGSRLFIVQIFVKILSRTLFRESHRPEYFKFMDMQYTMANRVGVLGQVISSIFAFVSLGSCIIRFALISSHAFSAGSLKDSTRSGENNNIFYALYIFYMLIVANSSLVVVAALLRPILRHRYDSGHSDGSPCKQTSLMCFHDEVYMIGITRGLVEADQLEILEFAYTKLSRDYKRNIRPPLIKEQNKDLISYLYHNQQGIAMTCENLKSHNVWKQQVAANLPGFWAEEPRIELQTALFWALCERVCGAGKDAESALNSIESLGQAWAYLPESKPYPFLINNPATATNIVDTLVCLLLKPIRPTLLFQLRAFEACCRNSQVLRHMYGGQSPQEAQESCRQLQALIAGDQQNVSKGSLQQLCVKLLNYVCGEGIWVTTRIYAGNTLLNLLSYGEGKLADETMESLREPVKKFIDPAAASKGSGKQPYLWLNDMILVEMIRKKLQMASYGKWEGVRIIGPNGTQLSVNQALANL